jgi:membrane-bound serine protease (ClpP class)
MNKKQKIFFFFLLTLSILVFLVPNVNSAEESNVLIVEINGEIDHATLEKIKESLKQAKNENSQAIIMLLDTPGGGLQETFEIADIIQNSSIPFITYVYPEGAAAWSAGTFILVSSHVTAMAENTVIGSCQPVKIGPTGTELVEDSKTINALVAWIQNRAKIYNRNSTTAKRFITENLNLNATDAQKYGINEHITPSIDQLLKDIDGLKINTSNGNTTLNTANAEKIYYQPSIPLMIVETLSNPILTSLLLLLGVYAILFGISSPGFGAEVFGVIAVMLSLIGSGFSIPILSIIFIIIGMVLLLIEVFAIPGFGVVGIGGIISLAVGAIFLVPSYSTTEWMIQMDWINDLILVVIFAVALIAAFFAFLLYKIIVIRSKKKATGVFIGEKAKATDDISPEDSGYVLFKGEYWKAKSDKKINKNDKVVITKKEGSTLHVKPLEEKK